MVGDEQSTHMFALRPGALLHEFRIDAVLGYGGFGITYKAFDTQLHKAVAIKEYLPNDLAGRTSDSTVQAKSPDDRQQFQDGVAAFLDEARLVARLRHRNIMEVLRFFKLNGTGYIVLGYEQGRTLKQRLDDGPLDETELRRVLGGLLDGIEVLHEEAILHRDLKPSNVILSDSRVPGERGVPVLIDFGAARDFRSRHSRSVTTIVAPGYAPPEQYGIGGQAGPWSDLYALGATAYRCVTGEAPPEALRRLRKDPYIPAAEAVAGRYDQNLLHLIDTMLSVDEADRPQSAAEVKEALRSRSRLAIPAPDRRPMAQAGAAAAPKRSRRLMGIVASVAVAAVVALSAVLWQDGRIPKILGTTELKTVAAPAASSAAIPAAKTTEAPKAEAAPKAAEMPKAEAPAKVAEPPKVEAPKEAAATPAQTTPPPVVKRTLVDAVAAGFEPVADTRHLSLVNFVAFSPDGRILASGSQDKTFKLWDVASGRELRTLTGHGAQVFSVAFSPDGRTLASVSDDNTIKLWDVTSGRELRTLKGDALFFSKSFAFSPDGRTLVSTLIESTPGSLVETIKLWDVAGGRELRTFKEQRSLDRSVAFSPDGHTLASMSLDGISLWDVAGGRKLRTLNVQGISNLTNFVRFSPNWRIVALGSMTQRIITLLDVASGRELHTLSEPGSHVFSVAFSPDGRTLASAEEDKTIKLWDVASGRELRTLTGHENSVYSVVFSPDGRTLASGSFDGTVNLWSVADGSLQARYLGVGTYGSVSLDGKGLPIAVTGDENAIYHFVKDGKEISVKEMRAMGYDLPVPGHK